MWTLPDPDNLGSTASTPRTDRPTDAGLPARIHRVLAAFGHPANTLILTSVGGDHPPADAVCLGASREDAPESGPVLWRGDEGLRTDASDNRLPADLPAEACSGYQLVVLDVGCRGLDDRSAAVVVADVAPAGTLAVLTHSHRDSGRLLDRSGAVIAALQDADLLYLQHIVIVEHPLSPQVRPQPERPDTAGTEDATEEPGRGLVDLTLFLRPGSPPQPRTVDGAAE